MLPPGEGSGNPLKYSCLENPNGQRGLEATVHGVAKVRHDLATNPPVMLPYLQKRFKKKSFQC